MGFEEDDRKAAEAKAKRLDRLERIIAADIEEKGIARVLAEFIRFNDRLYLSWPREYRAEQ